MRWIFWRHKRLSEPESGGTPATDAPEQITVVIESDSNPASSESRGVIVSAAQTSEHDRWLPRRRHRSATLPILPERTETPPVPATGLAAVLQCSRKLLRGQIGRAHV